MGLEMSTSRVDPSAMGRFWAWVNRPWRLEMNGRILAWIGVATGLLLRINEYATMRPLYMDESSLLENIEGRAIFDFHQVLAQDQMAPPAFLVIERLLALLPLEISAACRLFPLVSGLASVLLMMAVARRYLDPRAVPLAVWLLALSDHLIYYSAEIKQYSTDLALALAAMLLADPRPPESMKPRRFLYLAIFGLIAPWFSFPVVFALGGVGLQVIISAAVRKEWGRVLRAIAMSSTWLISFGGCFLLSRSILSPRRFIWDWWDFAFLPLPPRSTDDLAHLVETLANVFINPGSILTPWEFPITATIASVLAMVGTIALARRWPAGFFVVFAPLPFALLASALRQYPFHGRLLLFLVPTYQLLLAEGAAAIGRRTAGFSTWLLAAVLLFGQAQELIYQGWLLRLTRSRGFDTHGDLKNDLLDYLEYARRKAGKPDARMPLEKSELTPRDVRPLP